MHKDGIIVAEYCIELYPKKFVSKVKWSTFECKRTNWKRKII